MTIVKGFSLKFAVFGFILFGVTGRSQQPPQQAAKPNQAEQFKTHQLDSKLMKRQVPYGVFLPANYDTYKQERFAVVYLLHGLSGSYRTLAENQEALTDFAKRRAIFIFVEGGTGFFTDSATNPNDRYETYVINELIPEIDKKYRTIAERRGRAVAGVSMGGYGALKFGIKYPQTFSLSASWSGVISAASWRKTSELPPRQRLIEATVQAFGDGTDPVVLIANDLFKLFRDLPPDKVSNLPFFYLDCGTEDPLLKSNQELASIMVGLKIPHEYRQIPGGHILHPYRVADVLNLNERLTAASRARFER